MRGGQKRDKPGWGVARQDDLWKGGQANVDFRGRAGMLF